MAVSVRIFRLDHRTAVAADVVALLVFVVVGLLNHHGGITVWDFARDAVPFIGCWLLAGGAFDIYKRPRAGALVGTWLVGITGGVLLRALANWHIEADDGVFFVVALCFALLFVLAARTAASFLRT